MLTLLAYVTSSYSDLSNSIYLLTFVLDCSIIDFIHSRIKEK